MTDHVCNGDFRSDDVEEAGYHAGWHDHPHFMLLLPRIGTMRLSIEGQPRAQLIGPGDALVVRPGVRHATTTCAERTRHLAIYADARIAGPLTASGALFHVAPLPSRLLSLLTSRDLGIRRVELFDRLVFDELAHELPSLSPKRRASSGLALSVAAYIDASERIDLSLDRLASHFMISRRHLTRLFRAEHGISVHDYLIQVKIARAQLKLRVGECVSNVAYDVGFDSPSHFASVFRQRTGYAPSLEQTHFARANLRSPTP